MPPASTPLSANTESQQLWLEGVLDLLPVPILFADPVNGKVAFANRAAHELAGGRFPDEVPAALASGGSGEVEWQTPAGKRNLLVFSNTLPPMHGHPATPVLAFLDITRLKQAEEELRQASRAKDDFLGMLAHELRNPLAPMLNGLHVLRLSGDDRQTTERARAVMERQLRHMTKLVDELLDMSRITRGRVRLNQERLDLGRLVRQTAEDYRSTLDRAGLALGVQVPETPVWVLGDVTRLKQVLNNFLENAVKFSDRGGRVTVRLAVDEGQAVLAVRDTGIGIEAEMLPHLFNIFAQADRSLHRTRGGLGLGLSVVKQLVELHGGTVTAASAGPGHGAEFTVRLPLQGEPPALADMPAAPETAGERLRILIVEDNRDAAESLRLLLDLLGHEVALAHSGPAGVQAAIAWRPDVVLCDIGLPGLDGYGVAEALRQTPTTAGARLIAITGYGRDEDRLHSRQVGFDHHLTKPVDPQLLRTLLSRPE